MKIYHWFWVLMIPISILWLYFFVNGELVLDINVHDTYFVISYSDVFLLIASYFFVIGNIYFLYYYWSIPLIKLLSNFHKYASIIGLISIAIIKLYYMNFGRQDFPLFDDSTSEMVYMAIGFSVFLISQLLFIINIILGIFTYSIQRKTRN